MQCSVLRNAKTYILRRRTNLKKAQHMSQESAVFLHLKEKAYSFEESEMHILHIGQLVLKSVKEAIYIKLEQPSLSRGGGFQHLLSSSYNAVLTSVPQCFDNNSPFQPCKSRINIYVACMTPRIGLGNYKEAPLQVVHHSPLFGI